MAVYKPINSKAVVGDCLTNQIKKGNLYIDTIKLAMPYILIKLIECEDITDKQLLYSRYYDLIRTCVIPTSVSSVVIPPSFLLEGGGYLTLENGGYLLTE